MVAEGSNANGDAGDGDGSGERGVEATPDAVERYAALTGRFVRGVELAAAAVFAVLFAVGVLDLTLGIVEAALSGAITDPLVVIGFIDTGLLLLIIVEVYQTVVAYIQEDDTRRIVRLVAYTGVIAMVRKAIIFRTGEYASATEALFAAVSYTVILVGLVALLYVEGAYLDELLERV
ncbi:phosphate-starvation-inducible PsiE family protein [Halosimplex halobium]|uniref:phosphate-starvation-inducible PsiE family protein n=1 Tax=Halosimplex halobium TaxID=3396618 RepID=UPI003F56A5FE